MRTVTIRLDSTSRLLLTVIAALLAVIAVELCVYSPSTMPQAQAQIPDTALQRKQLVDEVRAGNALLSDILEQLRAKVVKVRVVGPDKGQ